MDARERLTPHQEQKACASASTVPAHLQSKNDTLLFGRESQERKLLEAYRRLTTRRNDIVPDVHVVHRQEIVLITGASGTGKTILARRLERRVRAERGYFCWGKCDQIMQMQSSEPFAPFNAAVNQLVNTLLQQDDSGEETVRMEEAIEEATKDSGTAITLLTSLFPVFRKVLQQMDDSLSNNPHQGDSSIHSNSTLERLNSAAENPRKNHAHSTTETPAMIIFSKFLRAFCCASHPFVMLLDDWQWLDTSSLQLLKTLASLEPIPGFMILGTCRGNEVSIQDPLSVVLRALEEQHVQITDIQLTALSIDEVQDMITNLLQLSSSESAAISMDALAELIHRITGGNPFYVQQNVRALYDAKLIYFNEGSWQWDEQVMEAHDNFEITRNKILDTTVQKLVEQSRAIGETLTVAAFLGASFSLNHLQLVITTSNLAAIQNALNTLVEQGILYDLEGNRTDFQWVHDRYQFSALSLVPQNEQPAFSVEMGRKLLLSLAPDQVEANPFLLCNLFLRGELSLFSEKNERVQLAHLLHIAATKAAASSAFESAAFFFSHGIEFLEHSYPEGLQHQLKEDNQQEQPQEIELGQEQSREIWGEEYNLILELYNGAIEMECCNGRFERSDELFEVVIENARDLEDMLRVYEAKLTSLAARHLDSEAVQLGFKILNLLGEPFPKKAILLQTLVVTGKTVLWLRRASTERILKTRPLRRWDKIAALRILQIIVAPIIRANPEYSALWACRGVYLTTKYGLSNMSAPMFTALGMILATVKVGLPNDARRCADIAHKLGQQYHAPEWRCRLLVYEYGYINWWHQSVASCMPTLLTGMRAGLVSGDVHTSYIHITFFSFYGILCTGMPLQDNITAIEDNFEKFERLDQKMLYISLSLELARRLCSNDTERCQAADFASYCDKGTFQDELKWGLKDPSILTLSASCQLFLSVYTKDWVESLRIWQRLRRLPFDETWAVIMVAQLYFLFGMAESMAACETNKKRNWAGWKSLRKLRAIEKSMTCPENIVNKTYLLEAERASLRGDKPRAQKKFLSSIDSAKASGFMHEQALAHERFALSLSQWGDAPEAKSNNQQAAALYQRWGFSSKAAQLTKTSSN